MTIEISFCGNSDRKQFEQKYNVTLVEYVFYLFNENLIFMFVSLNFMKLVWSWKSSEFG